MRGRKEGSKMVDCPECIERILVTPGEVKLCPHCMAKIGRASVRRLIREANNQKVSVKDESN